MTVVTVKKSSRHSYTSTTLATLPLYTNIVTVPLSQLTSLSNSLSPTVVRLKPITLMLITDEIGTVYIDGIETLTTKLLTVHRINISASFKVIAITVNNFIGRIGFMAETSSGIVTNKSWKCTNNLPLTSWMNVNFNDNQWPKAVPYSENGRGADFLGIKYREFPPERLWISVENPVYTGNLYCRKTVKSTT